MDLIDNTILSKQKKVGGRDGLGRTRVTKRREDIKQSNGKDTEK